MLSQRQRTVLWAAAALVVIWGAAMVGYSLFRDTKVTPEKVRAYVDSVDLARLAGGERERAIRKLRLSGENQLMTMCVSYVMTHRYQE